jgi:hypothetical protein
MSTAYDTLSTNVDTAMGTAGTSVSNFGTTVNEVIYGGEHGQGAIQDIEDLGTASDNYNTTAIKQFNGVASAVVGWYKSYGSKLKKGRVDTDNLEESIAELESKELTVDTEVNGQDEVEALTEAIEGVKTAIETL